MGAYTVTGQRARQMRVVPAEVLKRLYARDDTKGLIQTGAHLALLVLGGWLVLETRGTWWVLPALLLQGIFVNSLFGAMHESVHYGSFKTRWMADLLAFFSGAAILNNAGFYRHYHLAHHRYTQDPERDPELITSVTPTGWRSYLFRVSAIPFLKIRVRDIFLFPFGFRGDVTYIHDSAWPEVRRWGRWLLAFYAVLIVGSILLRHLCIRWHCHDYWSALISLAILPSQLSLAFSQFIVDRVFFSKCSIKFFFVDFPISSCDPVSFCPCHASTLIVVVVCSSVCLSSFVSSFKFVKFK